MVSNISKAKPLSIPKIQTFVTKEIPTYLVPQGTIPAQGSSSSPTTNHELTSVALH